MANFWTKRKERLLRYLIGDSGAKIEIGCCGLLRKNLVKGKESTNCSDLETIALIKNEKEGQKSSKIFERRREKESYGSSVLERGLAGIQR